MCVQQRFSTNTNHKHLDIYKKKLVMLYHPKKIQCISINPCEIYTIINI